MPGVGGAGRVYPRRLCNRGRLGQHHVVDFAECLRAPCALCLQHKLDKRTKANLLRDAGYRLAGSGVASRDSMEFVLHARVPIVKFADRATGIEVCTATTRLRSWGRGFALTVL